MDTKKKAEELVEKYQELLSKHIFNGYFDVAQECAILCVDEIIESHHSCEDCEEEGSIELRDWGRVKEHLNNM